MPKAPREAYVRRPAPPVAPVGATGLKHTQGRLNEEIHVKLSGSQAMRVYREMHDNSAILGGGMKAAEETIAATSWSVEASGGDGVDAKAAELVKTALTDMDSTWQDFVSEIMTMGAFGFAFMEEIYKYRRGDSVLPEFNSKFDDGMIGWRNIALRGQETLWKWEIDPEGTILGMHQNLSGTSSGYGRGGHIRFVPSNRALLFRTKSVKNSPEGRSWYRNAYRSWFIAKRLEEIEAIGVERNIAGYPDYQAPPEYFKTNATTADAAALSAIKDMVQKVRADAYAGIVRPAERDRQDKPTGHAFKLLQGGGRDPAAFDPIIRRYESRQLISMLAEFLVLGMDKVGSFALSSDKTDLWAVALSSVLRRIEDVMNRVAIPRLVAYNGMPRKCSPRFSFGDIETRALAEYATAIGGLISVGGVTPDAGVEKYLRTYLGLPQQIPISTGQMADAVGTKLEQDDAGVDDAALAGAAEQAAVPKTRLEQQLEGTLSAAVPAQEIDVGGDKITLNGAQISSLLDVLREVRDGTVSREVAVEIITTAFNVPSEKAHRMIGAAEASADAEPPLVRKRAKIRKRARRK